MNLVQKKCIPWQESWCPMPKEQTQELLKELHKDWKLTSEEHILRNYNFSDFATAMNFANRVAKVAEQENHHPDLHIAWNKFAIEIWTHRAGGVTENDFILAAKIDKL